MKLFIDEVTVGDLVGIVIGLPRALLDLIKEELFFWRKLYKYEFGTGSCAHDHDRALMESRRRMRHKDRKGGKG